MSGTESHGFFVRKRLSYADAYLASCLEAMNWPIVSQRDVFRMLVRMHSEAERKGLYLRERVPTQRSCLRRIHNLCEKNVLRRDRDYRAFFRVLTVPDRSAEDVACLVDRYCYISRLSAMQRWSLTNKRPAALLVTRPDQRTISRELAKASSEEERQIPFPLRNTTHPTTVRGRSVEVRETKVSGASVREQGGFARIATIGQTFLDMLQRPAYYGGMYHVLEVWDDHATDYCSEIVDAVDRAVNQVVKCRAGYILEERLGARDPRVASWEKFAQRGGSRKLDPDRSFASSYSKKWKISLNAE